MMTLANTHVIISGESTCGVYDNTASSGTVKNSVPTPIAG